MIQHFLMFHEKKGKGVQLGYRNMRHGLVSMVINRKTEVQDFVN